MQINLEIIGIMLFLFSFLRYGINNSETKHILVIVLLIFIYYFSVNDNIPSESIKDDINIVLDKIKEINVEIYSLIKNDFILLSEKTNNTKKSQYIKNDIDDILFLKNKIQKNLSYLYLNSNSNILDDIVNNLLYIIDNKIIIYKNKLSKMYKPFLSDIEGYK